MCLICIFFILNAVYGVLNMVVFHQFACVFLGCSFSTVKIRLCSNCHVFKVFCIQFNPCLSLFPSAEVNWQSRAKYNYQSSETVGDDIFSVRPLGNDLQFVCIFI